MSLYSQLVILGGGGFIGCALVAQAQQQNIDVLCISRSYQWSNHTYDSCSINFVLSDVHETQNYIHLISDNALIVYMAGSTDLAKAELNPASDLKLHIDSMLSVLSLLSSNHGFIFFSSGGTVYGEASLNRPNNEDDPLHPKSIYGHRNKLLESTLAAVCVAKNIHYMILRLANPYGLEQILVKRTGLILALMQSCIDQRLVTLRGGGLQRRDFFCVKDLCVLIFSLFKSPLPLSSGIVNVCSGVSYTGKQIVSLIGDAMGQPPLIAYNSESYSSDVFNSSLNKSKLDQLLTEIGCQQTLFEPFNNTLKGIDFATFNRMCKNNFNQLPF